MIPPRIRPAVPARLPQRPRQPLPVRRDGENEPAPAPASLVAWAATRSAAPEPDRTDEREVRTPILLPVDAHRYSPPETWAAVAGPGSAVTALLDLPEAEVDAAVAVLTRAGVRVLGRVDLEHGERPVTALLEELAGWARRPVAGLLLDRCPAAAEELGTAALAVRHAHRLGLTDVLLNPGTDPHPRYRCLGAEIIGFAGSWHDYQRTETRPGDGHLVFDVPAALLPLARRLIALRGAAWALATPVPAPARPPGPR